MTVRVAWISAALLAFAGLYVLLYPLPTPGGCLWAWGALQVGLKNCTWNTSREASAMFVLPSLFGLGLLVVAGWSIAFLMGVRPRTAAIAAGALFAVAGGLAMAAYVNSVDLGSRPATRSAAPFAVLPPASFAVRQSAALAAYFDQPPRHPGYAWTRNGAVVSGFEITTAAGPDHCGWQSATFLTIGWPPGTVSASAAGARQYIRDPHGAIRGTFLERLETQATMPRDARPTGHRFGDLQVFVSPSDQDEFIYLQSGYGTERWPRSDPMTACD